MSLDISAVRAIATLARIEVGEDDLVPLAGELSKIIDFVEHLAEVDTDGIVPMSSVADLALPMREDVVTDGGIADRILANAPEAAEGFFTVPKVVE